SLAFPERIAGAGLSQGLIALAAAVGCIAVVPGMLNGYWQGQQRRGLMLALSAGTAAAALAAALAAPQPGLLAFLALAQALPALAAVFVVRRAGPGAAQLADYGSLRRYILPGVAIGLLTPLATLAVRDIVSAQMSWHDVALIQAL